MERSTIRYAVISFTLIAFILFLVSGTTTTHYLKQNTAITSVKGFTAYTDNGFNYWIASNELGVSSGNPQYSNIALDKNYTIPNNYTAYFGYYSAFYYEENPLAMYYINNASNVETYSTPELNTYSYYNSNTFDTFMYGLANNSYFAKGYKYWNETKAWIDISLTADSSLSAAASLVGSVFAFSTQMVNISQAAGFSVSSDNYSFSVVKGQVVFTIDGIQDVNGQVSIPYPSYDVNVFKCNNDSTGNITYQICIAQSNSKAWIKANGNYLEQPILTQKPQTLNFVSNFNYVGASCIYVYGYKPIAELTYPFNSTLSVSAVQPITTSTLRYTTSFILDSGNGATNNYSIPSSNSNASYFIQFTEPNITFNGVEGVINTINPHLNITEFRNQYSDIITNTTLNTATDKLYYLFDNKWVALVQEFSSNPNETAIMNESQLNITHY